MSGIILHGNIAFSESFDKIRSCPDSYVVAADGICRGVFDEIPEEYEDFPVDDHWDKLIIPGLVDLHSDVAGFQIRGMNEAENMGEWDRCLSEEERHFSDPVYALRANDMFIDDLYCGATTRAVVHASEDTQEILRLMELLDDSGLISCVALKIRSRKEFDRYIDLAYKLAALDEENEYDRVALIPSVSERLSDADTLRAMGELESEDGLTAAREGEDGVWSLDDTMIWSPRRDLIYGSPAVPVSAGVLDKPGSGMMGMCTDTGLSGSTGMLAVCRDAMTWSHLRPAGGSSEAGTALTPDQAFFLATAGGGSFFGRTGTFKKGFEFDAVVIDDQNQDTMHELNPRERLLRMIQFGDERNVVGKYVLGDKLY